MKAIVQKSLFYKEGSSDKVYHAQLVEKDGGEFAVNFQYGRRGSTLTTGTKIETADKAKAEKEFDKLIKSKTSKGYTEEASGEVFSSKEFAPQKTSMLPQLLNPVEDPEMYITDDSYIAQEKMDGERRMIESTKDAVQGVNRKGLAVQLPEVVESSVKGEMELDGESIGEIYYVFDLLSLEGKDLRSSKAIDRVKALNKLKFGKGIKIVPTATTTAEKRALFEDIKKRKAEGIVFKKKDSPYKVGRPNSGGDQLKFKLTKTATFIVQGKTEGKRSVALVLREGSGVVGVGKVTIPPNHEVPKEGSLVEVEYLYAHRGGAIFQPVYLGVRSDLDESDAVMAQLVYKEGT